MHGLKLYIFGNFWLLTPFPVRSCGLIGKLFLPQYYTFKGHGRTGHWKFPDPSGMNVLNIDCKKFIFWDILTLHSFPTERSGLIGKSFPRYSMFISAMITGHWKFPSPLLSVGINVLNKDCMVFMEHICFFFFIKFESMYIFWDIFTWHPFLGGRSGTFKILIKICVSIHRRWTRNLGIHS